MTKRAPFCLLLIVLVASGCLDPRFTRLPTIYPSHPVAENRSYQRMDPYPDPNLGGELSARPREFVRPRTEPRRAAEQRMLRGLQFGPETIPPFYAPSAQRYSNSVH